MPDNSDLQLINKINSALVGTLDFRELARQAAQIVLRELDLAAVAIFRVDHQTGEMRPYAYATKLQGPSVTKIARQPTMYSRESLMDTGQNPAGAHQHRTFDSHAGIEQLQKDSGTRFHTSLPLRIGGRVEGVLFCATRQGRLTKNQFSLLKTAADQLGLAMANVMAHEQIIEQYKKTLGKKSSPKTKVPKIKFTLRITKEIEQFLTYKVTNTKHSKADYVRRYLEKRRLEDSEYKNFLAEESKT